MTIFFQEGIKEKLHRREYSDDLVASTKDDRKERSSCNFAQTREQKVLNAIKRNSENGCRERLTAVIRKIPRRIR